ncbi:paladin-like [Zingiber officinale]|uniref:paladin-like n=1 Tax=Zingiber officinale TaxID=94328 RepID=UPI001C4BFBDF|nr:paladin-like [Zingiber officinale]
MPASAEQVMNYRGGSVLGKKTILKSDHFPGCQNRSLKPQIDGAPNYRQAGSLHVHGVAIPTIDGIQNVLDHIGARKQTKQKRVLWHNLREEPVIYINNRPFVLRDVENPFSNLEYTGINRVRLEQMEFRLKEDILVEAARYGNKILVTDELPDGQMVDQWEPVMPNSIKTPLEVYEELQKEGYLVDYERIPITDEKSPKEGDFDDLVHSMSQVSLDTEILFNCQMGRGRTTTGMVIATLVYLNRIGASGISRSTSIGKIFASGSDVTDRGQSSEDAKRGEYAVIRSLIRVLEGGAEAKKQVDKVIDMCDSMQNLRDAIATYGNKIFRQPDEMKREALLSFFVEYLERYYFLICFAVFIHTQRAAVLSISSDQMSFSEWMKARPELYSILRRLLRRDPMGALGYSISRPSLNNIAVSTDGCPYEMGMVAAMRNGEVLGSQTVLKSDHCPGCQNLSLHERVDGAPNFRQVPGFPVYGVANPTVDGIRAVIQQIRSNGGYSVFWHNMREEPVIYINGKPFVLREVERPYKNMLEYTGIDCERVERMEARLKEDILREAECYGGAIMVIHETDDGQIFDAWEHIDAESIHTPLEVFKCLEFEGPIQYARVPITDGKAPKSSDFDRIASNIASAPKDTSFVFNCQMGRGRTTTGTVIACLVKLRIDHGKPMKMQRDDGCNEQLDADCSSGEETIGENGSPISTFLKSMDGREPHHKFGIDNILLLRKITRLFDNGIECREALDAIIDRCSALQNIRQAVLQYRKVINQQHVEPRVKRVALNRSAEYLERYFKLIAFSAYLGSEAFDGFCGQGITKTLFKTWLHKRPEIQTMKWSIRLRPGRFLPTPEEPKALFGSMHGDVVMDAIVKSRNGSVLGKGSILKMYFFPGQKTSSWKQFKGTPNVYKVDAYPVYSMATPTVDGAREVLSYLGAKDLSATTRSQKVIIIDLREEAVVYINGSPFVLRELDRPVDTLKHVGISGSLVEHMEARMKEDIFTEVKQSGGQMLLHREDYNPASKRTSVIGYWENISLEYVKTPAEVFAALIDEGYRIEYKRIPLTSEREALAVDVDAMQYCKDEFARYYLFISHTGYGGVSYAMAITCLGLSADKKFATEQTVETHFVSTSPIGTLHFQPYGVDALKQGDYRDILSLTRVLVHGPQSKHEVDNIINRCAGAGHLRDDILHYKRELDECPSDDDEHRSYLMDMGIKALRRYFFLITFRSYLYCTSPTEASFSTWMEMRPELRHLCDNLKLE